MHFARDFRRTFGGSFPWRKQQENKTHPKNPWANFTPKIPANQDDGKGGLGSRGLGLHDGFGGFDSSGEHLALVCWPYKIQCQETTVTVLTVLAVSAVVTVSVGVPETSEFTKPPGSYVNNCWAAAGRAPNWTGHPSNSS